MKFYVAMGMLFLLGCTRHEDVSVGTSVLRLSRIARYIEQIRDCEGEYPTQGRAGIHDEIYCLPAAYFDPNSAIVEKCGLDPRYLGTDGLIDPCSLPDAAQGARQFRYLSRGDWFILVSCGPDRRYEDAMLEAMVKSLDNESTGTLATVVPNLFYDPTNGTPSRGDIVVTSSNLGVHIHLMDLNTDGYYRYYPRVP